MTFMILSPHQVPNDDERNVLRQALSGMLWSKQYYDYDVAKWLNEHQVDFYTETKKASTKHRTGSTWSTAT